jgi:hypothetical protein
MYVLSISCQVSRAVSEGLARSPVRSLFGKSKSVFSCDHEGGGRCRFELGRVVLKREEGCSLTYKL